MFDQITARELADELDAGEELAVVDTRPADSYESWHVPGAANLPFGPTETLDDEQAATVDDLADGNRIVTICGKGATSTSLAAELDANGYDDVAVVKGGMRDWNALYERARVDDPDWRASVLQFQRRGKGCLSYLVWDPDAGEAAVVDPSRHVDQYVVAAAERGVEVVRVVDTHLHADHISGGRELADRLGVPYHLGARAGERDVERTFDPVEDGDVLRVGGVDLAALAAPGHTTEQLAYRVDGAALLTGDALFLDSVGRPELQFGEESAERGAELEYETLDALLARPDELTVLPGHVTVTDDGRFENGAPGEPVAASLAEVERRLDLTGLDRETFVQRLVEDLPEEPDDYETVVAVNSGRERADGEREATTLETGSNNCAA